MSKDDLKKYREVAGALGKALSKAIGCRENNRLSGSRCSTAPTQ